MATDIPFPLGIGTAFEHITAHAIPPNPIIPGNPVIPGNPIFEFVPAAPILQFLFSENTVDVLGVSPLPNLMRRLFEHRMFHG